MCTEQDEISRVFTEVLFLLFSFSIFNFYITQSIVDSMHVKFIKEIRNIQMTFDPIEGKNKGN